MNKKAVTEERPEPTDPLRNMLMKLDHAALVDGIVDIASGSYPLRKALERLGSSSQKRIDMFNQHFAFLMASPRFKRKHQLSGQSILDHLSVMLGCLVPTDMLPESGLALLERFYATDSIAFESTNEFDYEFEVVYTVKAVQAFAAFATQIQDAGKVVDVVNRIAASDHYGVRQALVEKASTYLPEHALGLL